MFLWAGRVKEVPLCFLAADGGPNPAPRSPSTSLGVIQVNFGAGAAVARRSLPARWSQRQTWQRQVPNYAAPHTG